MDKLSENVAKIIAAAAQSTLGIFAMLVIGIAVLAYLFFSAATEKIKVGIFVLLFCGVAAFGWAIVIEKQNPPAAEVSISPLPTSPTSHAPPSPPLQPEPRPPVVQMESKVAPGFPVSGGCSPALGIGGCSENHEFGGSCEQGWTRKGQPEIEKIRGGGSCSGRWLVLNDEKDCRIILHAGAEGAQNADCRATIYIERPIQN